METLDSKRGANLATLQTILRVAVDFLQTLDPDQFFYNIPSDSIAPGYSRVITQPMAISLIQGRMGRNHYKNLESLNDDVLLIHKNCFTYNGVASPYSKVNSSPIIL